jgi:hypothetical protein
MTKWYDVCETYKLDINKYVTPSISLNKYGTLYEFNTIKHKLYIQLNIVKDDLYLRIVLHPFIKDHKQRVWAGYLNNDWLLLMLQLLNQYFIL